MLKVNMNLSLDTVNSSHFTVIKGCRLLELLHINFILPTAQFIQGTRYNQHMKVFKADRDW
jgi:hypothetical protein